MDEKAWKKRQQLIRQGELKEREDTLARIREYRDKRESNQQYDLLFGEHEFWEEGFCEDCGNYAVLKYADGLYLCDNCQTS